MNIYHFRSRNENLLFEFSDLESFLKIPLIKSFMDLDFKRFEIREKFETKEGIFFRLVHINSKNEPWVLGYITDELPIKLKEEIENEIIFKYFTENC